MLIDDVIRELRKLNNPLHTVKRLPTKNEVQAVEHALGVVFQPDYRKYLLEASDVEYGHLEPATATESSRYTHIVGMAQAAWELVDLPRHLLPICEDNGDYFCLNTMGEVVYWSHNGTTDEKWPDLATWIKVVWIAGE